MFIDHDSLNEYPALVRKWNRAGGKPEICIESVPRLHLDEAM